MATSCSSPKRNILALKTACAKVIKRHNCNNNNNIINNNNNINNKERKKERKVRMKNQIYNLTYKYNLSQTQVIK